MTESWRDIVEYLVVKMGETKRDVDARGEDKSCSMLYDAMREGSSSKEENMEGDAGARKEGSILSKAGVGYLQAYK